MTQGKLFGNPPRAKATPSILLKSSNYARENRAIAQQILSEPERHITGLVEWAKLVMENEQSERSAAWRAAWRAA